MVRCGHLPAFRLFLAPGRSLRFGSSSAAGPPKVPVGQGELGKEVAKEDGKEPTKEPAATTTRTFDLGRVNIRGEILGEILGEARPKAASPPAVSARPLNFEEAREVAQKALGQQTRWLNQKIEDVRVIFGGQSDQSRTPDQEWYYKRVSFWMKRYENFVGLTEVKAAQARVVECERKFIDTQDLRREATKMISDVQKRIKDIHLELEKTHRGEDRYLLLVTQEHQVLKEENNLRDDFKFYEKGERENFSNLSNAVRNSHEKERAQAEKTKYWSIIGSIIGACIGIIGTTINNRLRMAELRRLVSQNSSVEEIQAIGAGLAGDFTAHQADLARLVTEVQEVLGQAGATLAQLDRMEELFVGLKETSQRIDTRELDGTVAELRGQQEQLAAAIGEHQARLDEKIELIQSDLFVQSKNVGQLSHITLKDREKEAVEKEARERTLHTKLDTIKRKAEALECVVESNTRGIEDKMKDVRSLLLVEAQVPRLDNSRWQERLTALEERQTKVMREGFAGLDERVVQAGRGRALAGRLEGQGAGAGLTLVELDTVVEVLAAQERRTQRTVPVSALSLAVLGPCALYAANHLL